MERDRTVGFTDCCYPSDSISLPLLPAYEWLE